MVIGGTFPYDKAAQSWAALFDVDNETGYTTIKVTFPSGWATDEVYLVISPFDSATIIEKIDNGKVTVNNAQLGSRGYVYAAAKLPEGGQKNTPIVTYRIEVIK